MCVCATAKRRRRQAANDFNHLAPKQRPNFKRTSAEISSRRLAALITAERARNARKANK
jgi:hypothetical protein